MIVKINGYNNVLEVLKTYNSQKKQPQAKERGPGTESRGDTLDLSVQAREMQEIQSGLKEVKDIRQEKVALLKDQIGAGTYRADASKIAEGILRERHLDKQA